MEKINDLGDLLRHEITDLYSVEEQILDALPHLVEKASDSALKSSLSAHMEQTGEHRNRLDKIQKFLHQDQQEKKGFLTAFFGNGKQKCKGVEGIIEEGNKMMSSEMPVSVLDALIIAAVQKIEHYEICGYGTARTYALELKLEKVAALLQQTLDEEYKANDDLTMLAESRINMAADNNLNVGNNDAKGSKGPDLTGISKAATISAKERRKRQEPQMEPVTAKSSERTRPSASAKEGRQKPEEHSRTSGSGKNYSLKKAVPDSANRNRTSKSNTKIGDRGNSAARSRG